MISFHRMIEQKQRRKDTQMQPIFLSKQQTENITHHTIDRSKQKRQQSTSQPRIIKELDDKSSQVAKESFRLNLLIKISLRIEEQMMLFVIGNNVRQIPHIGHPIAKEKYHKNSVCQFLVHKHPNSINKSGSIWQSLLDAPTRVKSVIYCYVN